MLGRLFNKGAQGGPVTSLNAQLQTQAINPGVSNSNHHLSTNYSQHIPQTPPAVSINTFEDPYTREILYGTQNASQVKPRNFPFNHLRIVISQDGGSFRLKQVLLDTANNEAFEMSPSCSRNASHSPSPSGPKSSKLAQKHPGSKSLHGAGELNEYMFGSSLPTHELHASVKVHILPDSNLTAQHAILLSRVFSITDAESEGSPSSNDDDYGRDWCPKATIRISDRVGDHPLPLKRIINSKDNSHFSGRFAIGVVVPLESLDDAEDVIFDNWDEFSRFFVALQKLTCKKLISHLTARTVSSYNTHEISDCVVNKRIQFPPFALKLDVDINNQLHKLKKLIYCNANIPRLINSNALIKSCVQENELRLKPMLLHWVLEVLNWLEFRDGKNMAECRNAGNRSALTDRTAGHKYSFLASLVALLLEHRSLMALKPFGASNTDFREITRIVIMTSNPVVAKRLVFIVNALIPQSKFDFVIEQADTDCEPETSVEEALSQNDRSYMKEEDEDDECKTNSLTGTPSLTFDGLPVTHPDSFDAHRANAVPIPATSRPCNASQKYDNRSSFSRSFSSAKGWEIPTKTFATTYSNAPQHCYRTEGSLQGIPIAKATLSNPVNDRDCTTLSETSTYSYLSSSLSLSVLSASNYSLSRIGGSFMDKWKNSFSSYGSLNNGSYGALHNALAHCAGNAMLVSASTELADYFAPRLSVSIHANRAPTPSPACEPDSAVRDESYSSHSGPGYFGVSRPGSATITDTLTGTDNPPHLNGPSQLSRTQSMFDLCSKRRNEVFAHDNSVILEELDAAGARGKDQSGVDNDLAIQRTIVSVIHPLIYNKEALDISEQNMEAVKAKCTKIMQLKSMDFSQVLLGTVKVALFCADRCPAEKRGGGALSKCERQVTRAETPIVGHSIPLLPNVAFSDEFRPEFGLQSCPVNPKLEGQIMSAMKNDMLFNQHHTRHDGITTRTVLVSLRAREIEVIEMRLNDMALDESFVSEKSLSSQRKSEYETASPHNGFSPQKLRAHNRYKSRVRKVYSPLKNRGNRKTMQHVQSTFDDIVNLFARQQKQSASMNAQFGISPHLAADYSKNNLSGSGFNASFHRDLTELVMQLL